MITKIQAVLSLVPNAQVVIRDGVVEWHEPTIAPVTDEQIEAELAKLQAEEEANAYKAKRAAEYPAIGDQLDALFHAGVFPPEMAALIQAVKDKYPKGQV